MGLDVLLLIPAAYGVYLLREQGSMVMLQEAFGADPLQNPLLFLVPVLSIFALTLSFLRFMPLLMSALSWLAARMHAVGLLMATRHLARTPNSYATPLILLVLTLSLSAFTASLAYTLDQHMHDQHYYEVGADMRFLDQGEGKQDMLAAFFEDEGGNAADEGGNAADEGGGPRWLFLPVSDYLNATGVEAVTRVGRYPAVSRFSGGAQAGVFIGVDRADFGNVAFCLSAIWLIFSSKLADNSRIRCGLKGPPTQIISIWVRGG